MYNVSEENGLSDNHTTCVLKDNRNLVWIGTADGLNVMNGSTINIFKHAPDNPNSICDNGINCLAQDEQGNIWIGTKQGLCYFEKSSHRFIHLSLPLSNYGSSEVVKSLLVDHSHRIWCGTDGGLYLYQAQQRSFIPFFNASADSLSRDAHCNSINSLIEDHASRIWLCTGSGLWSLDPLAKTFRREITEVNDERHNNFFLCVFEDHSHQIWTGNYNGRLKLYDPILRKVTVFEPPPGEEISIIAIKELQQGAGNYVFWLNGKFLGFNPQKKAFFHFPKPFQYKDYPAATPSFYSGDKWMWMTTDNDGLYAYNTDEQRFTHLLFDKDYSNQIIVFNTWQKQLVVGGNASHFLTVFDDKLREKKTFSIPLPNAQVVALNIQKETENNWWVATSKGVLHFFPESGAARWYRHNDGDSSSLPDDFVIKVFPDAQKRLWLFPWRKGIWQLDSLSGKCTLLCEGFIKEGSKTKPLVVSDAVADEDQNIWMSDYNEGIILFERKTGKFSKPFLKELGERSTVSRLFVRKENIYAFTSDRIIKWNTRSRAFQSMSLPVEMDKAIYDITPDSAGNWWLATKDGLVFFDEKLHAFQHFTTTDGLLYNDMNGNLFLLNDSTIVFGARAYFTSFNPHSLLKNATVKENILVADVTANGESVAMGKDNSIRLKYDKNNLVFKWSLPDYTSPFKNHYYCRLLSIDKDWRYVGNKGEIQYANLSPGNYTLELKAENANGISTADNLTIHFVIDPPIWKQAWFMALVFLVVLSGAIVVIRYIAQRKLKERLLLLEKEQAIEKERNRISRDMHDDLGSGLTKIAVLSEVTKKQLNEPEKAQKQLEAISESSRELVDSLQDIIWVLNPKNDTLESLASYIREYALKFFEPFKIRVQFYYPEALPHLKLSEEKRRNIFLVVKETFNNILKHAWCNSVQVSFRVSENVIKLTIRDDGKGFDPVNAKRYGNGLANMKTRALQAGGTYTIISAPGKGTTTNIEIPA